MFQIIRVNKRKAGRGFTHKPSLLCIVESVTVDDLNAAGLATVEPDTGVYHKIEQITCFKSVEKYIEHQKEQAVIEIENAKREKLVDKTAALLDKLSKEDREALLSKLSPPSDNVK
jgi:hypothetical protein